jgi:hypothetical protein
MMMMMAMMMMATMAGTRTPLHPTAAAAVQNETTSGGGRPKTKHLLLWSKSGSLFAGSQSYWRVQLMAVSLKQLRSHVSRASSLFLTCSHLDGCCSLA